MAVDTRCETRIPIGTYVDNYQKHFDEAETQHDETESERDMAESERDMAERAHDKAESAHDCVRLFIIFWHLWNLLGPSSNNHWRTSWCKLNCVSRLCDRDDSRGELQQCCSINRPFGKAIGPHISRICPGYRIEDLFDEEVPKPQ